MNSRRVHRVRAAQRQANDILETYRHSSRGLLRVFQSIVPESDGKGRAVAARAAHHLAEVEAFLPHLREAIRSCRYPGAENGDRGALVWGLWGQLSETSSHLRGAIDCLEKIGSTVTGGRSGARGAKGKAKGARSPRRTAAKGRSAARRGRGTRTAGARRTPKRKPPKRKSPKRTTKRKDRRTGGR